MNAVLVNSALLTVFVVSFLGVEFNFVVPLFTSRIFFVAVLVVCSLFFFSLRDTGITHMRWIPFCGPCVL